MDHNQEADGEAYQDGIKATIIRRRQLVSHKSTTVHTSGLAQRLKTLQLRLEVAESSPHEIRLEDSPSKISD
jgi:hypothetical protein